MPIDNKFILRKIKLIQEDLSRLEKLSGYTFEQMTDDDVKLSAAERYLERIIMRAIDVNQHVISTLARGDERVRGYEDTFYVLAELGVYDQTFAKQIAPSAGLRNRLVHEYNDTEEAIIYRSIGDALKDYASYCNYVLNFLEAQKQPE